MIHLSHHAWASSLGLKGWVITFCVSLQVTITIIIYILHQNSESDVVLRLRPLPPYHYGWDYSPGLRVDDPLWVLVNCPWHFGNFNNKFHTGITTDHFFAVIRLVNVTSLMCFCIQFFVSLTMRERSGVRQVVGLVMTSLLSTPLMMAQMAALQLISLDIQGMPSVRSLVAVLILYIGVVSYSWGSRKMERRSVRV